MGTEVNLNGDNCLHLADFRDSSLRRLCPFEIYGGLKIKKLMEE